MRYQELLLVLGQATSGLSLPINRERLVESLKTGDLNPGYIIALRDRLTAVLKEVEREEN